ncbi:MAG: metallophosphoesterase [Solirubrobacteraceae bacterium]|nr:metallophosphoesterase [Solirubrobacteraceae bacterium]
MTTDRPDPLTVVAVSDLHGHLPEIPACDLLLIAGDLTPATPPVASLHGPTDPELPGRQRTWLLGPFAEWLRSVPAKAIVGIAGNHDFAFRDEAIVADLAALPWTYLQDTTVEVAGLKIHGSPWQPWFHDWAFNAPKEDGEAFLAERFALIPADVDVLVVHGPPKGYGDLTSSGFEAGSTALLDAIERTRPRLAVFGHIHEAPGRWAHRGTELVNATHVDLEYQPVNPPIELRL